MITFKNVDDKDHSFIEKLFRSTREKELSLTNWNEELKRKFIQMQMNAQLTHYQNNFKGATHQIVLFKKRQAGRLYLWETANEFRIVDISILPEFTGRGIGSKILADIINAGKQKNKKVTLHVAFGNPAKKLYERLGFIKISEDATHEYMEYEIE